MYKHLKKRGVPPVKKDFINKDMSRKAKVATKKEEMNGKLEPEKVAATPTKHKLI
ncbi:MAG: hypothetical protein PHY80_06015 [Rickettsiales bacterium]|jgi:hypothetical protein|nr:hypothetical protein [Rickettsiales bacterium]